MKRVYTLLFVAILSLTAVSCFKDKGNYDYTPENRFEVTLQPEINNNEETYWVIKPTNAPDSVPFTVSVSQTLAADSTNLEVSWIILENETDEQDTVYGFRHTFQFPMGADRYYEVSLFVNDDLTGLSYRDDFSVRTREPFSYAWVVLHGEEGDRQLGFLDYPASNNYQDSASVVEDGYMSLRNIRRFEDAEFVAYTSSGFGDDNLLVLASDSAWVLDPYTMRMYYTNADVYWGSTPVDFSFTKSFAGRQGARSVLIAESGAFYVGDRWGYLYDVDLDPDMPTDYTATVAYPIPGESNGANLVWDGEAHRFYYQQAAPSDAMGMGRYNDAYKAGAVLRNIADAGDMDFTDAELENMELLWLGKGIPDLLDNDRDETATAIMREDNGAIHFIHFAYQDNSGSGVTSDLFYTEMEEVELSDGYEFTENTHFAASNAFASYLFFTQGNTIYRLLDAAVIEIEPIVSLDGLTTLDGEPVGSINEIVDMRFRVDYDPTGIDENSPTRAGIYVLTVAYNTADGGGITEIYLTTGGDLDHTTSYSGFGPIVGIDYMARMVPIGTNLGARDYID